MTDRDTILDLRRELEKARLALIASQTHLAAHAEANAALHCATTVMYSPLHATVTAAIQQTEHALLRTEAALTPIRAEAAWEALVADLDRCEHARHSTDPCFGCPGDKSAGNPHLRPGQVIGYGIRRNIVVPPWEDRHDPAAWRQPARPTTPGEDTP